MGIVGVYRPERVSPTLPKSPCVLTLLLVARFLNTLGLILLGLGPLLWLPFLPYGRLPLLRMAFGLLALLDGYGTRGFIVPLSSIGAP